MKKLSKMGTGPGMIPSGQSKAILRGGTFHRVQVLLRQGQTHVDHCGLHYKVTHQKDAHGRIICLWCRDYADDFEG